MTIPNNRAATDIGYALRQAEEGLQIALRQERNFLIEISDRIINLSEKYQTGDESKLRELQSSIRKYERKRTFYSRDDVKKNSRIEMIFENYNPKVQPIINMLNKS
jgi:hypothetical protein